MNKRNTLTFEQIAPSFHKWAKHFHNNYFEYWELINATWLDGRVRFLPQSKIKVASNCIRCDMIGYMRGISGSRRKSNFYNESYLSSRGIEGGEGFWNTIESDGEDVEQKDFIRFFTNHSSLSRIEKLIMNLMYIGGYNQGETSEVCGVLPSRISQIHKNLMARFRALDYSKVL